MSVTTKPRNPEAFQGADIEAARATALEALSLAITTFEGSRAATVAVDLGCVLDRAVVVHKLGTPATDPGDVMFEVTAHDRRILLAAAVDVEDTLTYGLEPEAEGAGDRARRMRPIIVAAQRVQALLGEEAAR